MADFEKLNAIVETQKAEEQAEVDAKEAVVNAEKKKVRQITIDVLAGRKTCKICNHPLRDQIEGIWMQAKDKYPVRQIVDIVHKQIDSNVNATNFRNHFGLNKGTSGELKPAHTASVMLGKTVKDLVAEKANELIDEKSRDVSVEELKRRSRNAGLAWLESIQGREFMMKDETGVKLLALSIDSDLKEKTLEMKRNQGSQMSAVLLGQIGLIGAIFGKSKEKEKPVEGTIINVTSDPTLPAKGTS